MDEMHTVTQNAVNTITQLGAVLPGVQQNVTVPPDYSTIPDYGNENIGELMGRVASYIQYLEYQVSLASVDYDNWNGAYEFEKKRIMLGLTSERRDIMEAKADLQLQQQKQLVMEKSAKLILLKAILDGQKRVLDSLSRELSRRSLVLQLQRSGA